MFNKEKLETTRMKEVFYPEYQALITEVNLSSMVFALNQIRQAESSWGYEFAKEAIFRIGHHRTFTKTYNSMTRVFNSTNVTGGLDNYHHFICSVICSDGQKSDGQKSDGQKYVGIIILRFAPRNTTDNAPQIAYILTYPNGYGYGSLLVQHAVNISLDAGYDGKLDVNSEPDAEMFYQKLGFEKPKPILGLINMQLTPADSDKWRKTDDGFQPSKSRHPLNSNWRCNIL
ncbi:GNAT family N-acetyltransferase [Xenorhabdus bharatensis]|uniref:GNAT family N-acetyltransferase n=1 Tax=Xenorhabdus bharatensis TaxID=3136256 RepID=UPI0030F44D00